MNRRRAILFAALFLAAIGLLAWCLLAPAPEPMYQGRTLSFRLESYYQHFSDLSVRQATTNAVRQAGTNAIPTLLRLLRARDSGIKSAILHWFDWHPRFKAPFVSAGAKNRAAYAGFFLLGHDAGTAVPELIQIYEADPGSQSAALVPEILCTIGPGADAAAPALIRATTLCTNADSRANGIRALGALRNQPEILVPAMSNFLHDPYFYARVNAVNALTRFGTNARPALPALTNMLNDPDLFVRMAVTNALTELNTIGPPPDAPPILR